MLVALAGLNQLLFALAAAHGCFTSASCEADGLVSLVRTNLSPLDPFKAQAEELCGAKNFRLSRTEVVALDSCALDSAGFYDDPEALLCFLGIKPPRCLRPLVVAFLKCALRLATALTPLQRDLR